MTLRCAIFVLCVATNQVFSTNYNEYKVLKINPSSRDRLRIVAALENVVDFWTDPFDLDEPIDFLVPPNHLRNVTSFLSRNRVPVQLMLEDVQNEIDKEMDDNRQGRHDDLETESVLYSEVKSVSKRGIFDNLLRMLFPQRSPRKISQERNEFENNEVVPRMNWRKYQRLGTIYQYLNDLQRHFPHLVELIEIGRTSERRPILVTKIGKKQPYQKPAIFIEAGIHAREWISPATATYIIKSLVENYENNRDLVDFYDFYILSVVNPDGYEYSHTNDRLWRKNRSSSRSSLGGIFDSCVGVDLNRNFGFSWGEGASPINLRAGAKWACVETYAGPRPWSEPETRAIADFIRNRGANWVMYLTFHSYGEKILYPWSHTSERIPDWQDLHDLGVQMAHTFYKASDTISKYKVGTSPGAQYLASGGSDDWARGEMGIKWVYLLELPDKGQRGFLLPPRAIVPVAKSTMQAVRVAAEKISHTIVK